MPPVLPILGNIALNLAVGIGASMLANAIRPQKKAATRSVTTSRGLSFELAVGEQVPLSAIWGRGRTGGQLTFAQEYDANNSWLKLKFDCGRGWYDAFEGLIGDEKALTLTGSNDDANGRVVEEYRDASGTPRMWVKAYDGRPGQAADAGLIAAAPTRWGIHHTSTATPYAVVTLNYQEDMFPNNSLPNFGFVWRGLRLYDWRHDSTMPGGEGLQRWDDQSTWTWSENPAVLAWNWRRGYWRNGIKLFGMGFSRYANDLAYFTSAANIADEQLFFEETNASLARYAFGREIGDDEEHLDVLRQFEECWCGSSFDRAGAYAPIPATAQVAIMTLDDKHLVDGMPVKADKWGSLSTKKTAVHGLYSAMSDAFVPTPFGSRINVDLEALVRGRKPQKFDQAYEHRIERAQVRAEIALRRNLFGAVRTETFSAVANVLEPGDPVIRNCEWGPTLMIVDSVEPGPDGLGKTVSMIAWSNSIVPDPVAGFLDLPTAPGTAPVEASRTLQVQGLNVAAYQRVTAGNQEPYARATWTQITDPLCDQVLVVVWPDGEVEADTRQVFTADAKLQSSSLIGPLKPETTYRRKALLGRKDGRQTYPTSEGTFTTGPFIAAVIVPDDSIGLEKLNQELRNTYGLVTREDLLGSVPDRLAQLEQDQLDLANGLGNVSDTSKRDVRVIKAQSGSNAAAVIEERKARVEADAANATLIQETIANLGNAVSDAFLRFDVLASDNLTFADIAVMGRIGKDGQIIESGIRVHLEVVGGVLTSQLALLAQKVVITDGVHTAEAFRFDPVNGRLVLKELAMERITSLDLTSLVIDGQNPEITFVGV